MGALYEQYYGPNIRRLMLMMGSALVSENYEKMVLVKGV
jgi:hypothetical protein